MNQDDELRQRLEAIFRTEAQDHLKAMVTHLLSLQRELRADEQKEHVEGLFRAVHTLKGAARSVGLEQIEGLCQAAESVMSRLVREAMAVTPALVELLQDTVAEITRAVAGDHDAGRSQALIGRLEATATTPGQMPEPSKMATAQPLRPPGATTAAAIDGTIRVSTALLDSLIFRAQDLTVAKLAAAAQVPRLAALVASIAALHGSAPAEADLKTVETLSQTMLGHLQQDAASLGRSVDALQREIRHIRMAPASTVVDLFPLMVRDLERENGKQVEWSTSGTELALDRKVLETIKDPLIHLVRNAVDHGIEAPAVRLAAGKPARGQLTLSLTQREGEQIEICLADDGGGLDLAEIRATAVRARLLTTEEAAALDDEQTQDLVFRSGFSTSPIITRVSGRGLGMAIVRERVESLGGTVDLKSEPKRGTTVTLVVPSTITTFRGLMVRLGNHRLLIAFDAVERVMQIAPEQIQHLEGRPTVLFDQTAVPCIRLGEALELGETTDRQPTAGAPLPCVVVQTGDQRVALLVDAVDGDCEAVIKELEGPLVHVRNVAGAALLGSGEIVIILRVSDLVQYAQGYRRPLAGQPHAIRRQGAILVVDDSITTRTVEKNILEVAGFSVAVAADGIEAWEMLGHQTFDLVVSDVDMPRMDGFELTERIRAHPPLKDLPIVLVTALESRDDKERGVRLGANAYLFKSSFAESNLLEIVRRLI
ncbi:MAG: hybrid sensor histidine kinase/response regulator [Sulfobacillus sp.]